MQVSVIEYARSIVGLNGANSSEINPATEFPVIDLLPEQKDIENLGGTMRLGLYPCKLQEGSLAMACYDDELVYERHRHRYEFNNEYREAIEKQVWSSPVHLRTAVWLRSWNFRDTHGSWLYNSIRNLHPVRTVHSHCSVNS